MPTRKGKIKTIFESRGFGFIKPDDGGKDIWFHATAVKGDISFEQLRTGDAVEFEAETGPRGMRARFVNVHAGKAADASRPKPKSAYRFLNPYNFVRFLSSSESKSDQAMPDGTLAAKLAAAGLKSEPVQQVPKSDLTLLGKCSPPPHDRYVGITGRITCSLENVTPLFVSDSEGVISRREHKSFEFFKLDDQQAIPASSLRGMIRSLFEAATNSCMHALHDARLSYHLPPQDALKLVPARVEFDGAGNLQLRLLPGATDLQYGQKPQGPQYAAWVPCYMGQVIRPSRNLKERNEYTSRPNAELNGLKHRSRCWAKLRRFKHPRRHFEFWSVEQLAQDKAQLGTPATDERIVEGYLCITNQNIENKHDERFFFHVDGLDEAPTIKFEKPKEAATLIDDYLTLVQDYQQRHREHVQKRIKDKKNPKLRDGNDSAFSRFIVNEREAKKLEDGDLVYAKLNQEKEVEFIVPVSVPRVAYKKSIADLLPDKRHLRPCEDFQCLCPACRVFGWVNKSEKEAGSSKNNLPSYAGRVRFSNAALLHNNGTMPETPLAILSSPKPTTTSFYLFNSNGNPEHGVDYDIPKAKLRGRKFYRHHKRMYEENYFRAGGRCDEQNRTVRDALSPGARFEFTIHFNRLAPVELGALLWALDLDGAGYHRLGYGKPLGFGSVKIRIENLEVFSPKDHYASITNNGWNKIENWQAQFITRFKTSIATRYDYADFDSLPNVEDLRALLGEPTEDIPIHYPRTARQPDPEGKNFEWFMGNNRYRKHALASATEDKGLPLVTRDGTEIK